MNILGLISQLIGIKTLRLTVYKIFKGFGFGFGKASSTQTQPVSIPRYMHLEKNLTFLFIS